MAVKIATSIDLFATYRSKGNYYVDKTGFIEDLLAQEEGVSLFTRPRRFGKTLFMSMLAEFFDITKKSRKLFSGLRISANKKLCKDWMNQYPVIFLSLKDVDDSSYQESLKKIRSLVSQVCRDHLYLLKSPQLDREDKKIFRELRAKKTDDRTLKDSLQFLTSVLYYHHNKPTIVLIDEYDAPITRADIYGYYDEMIAFMRGFLSSALKSNRYLNLGIITGCLRIAKESIFSELNNPKCYDISSFDYADAFGFTQAEVDRLLQDAGIVGKREEIKRWYDGYCFGKSKEIYCPWSIMNHVADVLKNPKASPRAYWLHSGKNELVRKFVSRYVPRLADDLYPVTGSRS